MSSENCCEAKFVQQILCENIVQQTICRRHCAKGIVRKTWTVDDLKISVTLRAPGRKESIVLLFTFDLFEAAFWCAFLLISRYPALFLHAFLLQLIYQPNPAYFSLLYADICPDHVEFNQSTPLQPSNDGYVAATVLMPKPYIPNSQYAYLQALLLRRCGSLLSL